MESWLLLLWLLAEPLSLDGDAKGAEIQLPAHICIELKVSSKSIHMIMGATWTVWCERRGGVARHRRVLEA